MKKKIIALGIMLILTISITACGQTPNTGSPESTGTSNTPFTIADRYTAEKITLDIPLDVYTSAVYGNTVYLYGAPIPDGYNEGDELPEGLRARLYILDMENDTPVMKPFDYQFAENEFLSNMAVNFDGSLDLLVTAGDENNIESIDIIYKRIDQNGTELAAVSLWDDLQDEEHKYPTAALFDDSGIYAAVYESIYIWDIEGKLQHKISVGNGVTTLSFCREGQLYALWYDADMGMKLAGIDIQVGTMKPAHDFGYDYYPHAAPGLTQDLLLISDRAVSEYELNSRSLKEVFSFISSNIIMDNNSFGRFLALEDGRIFWLVNDYSILESSALWFVRPMAEGEGPAEGETLVLGMVPNYFDQPIKRAVMAFNNTDPAIPIEIKEYGDRSDAGEEAGLNLLNMDIVNGKAPDIIVLPRRLALGIYAHKGVLADLYPLLDGDLTIGRADLQENILGAYEMEGKLLAIPLDYMLRTMVGPKSALGDIRAWNLDEMIAFVNGQMPDSEVFGHPDKSSVFAICLRSNGDVLVDWSKPEQVFDRDLFLKILNFANQFADNEISHSEIGRRLSEKQIQLMMSNTAGVTTVQFDSLQFGEPVAYPGFPVESGHGHLIESWSLMAISQSCRDKEAAWSFLSSMLTDEFQLSIATSGGNYPIRKSALEWLIDDAMTPIYYTDSNGIKQEQSKGMISSSTGLEMEIYAARAEDVQVLRGLIESADRIRSYDDQINNILTEEAQTFFSGAKSAEEATDVAASRIGIYVNEMR
jgi:ABC-type glycerol-3-phosphate transport system substrate-binding protein